MKDLQALADVVEHGAVDVGDDVARLKTERFECRTIASRVHAKADDLALLHVRGRSNDVWEACCVFAENIA